MASENLEMDKRPTPDPAENNAFFPSRYSLSQYTSPKSNLSGADYPNPYRESKWKVLMIGADERYLLMTNGTMFSTGNHPLEMLVPMYHMTKAGFDFDVATVSGNPVKLELWAFPKEDKEIQSIYEKYLSQLKSPLKLSDVIKNNLGSDSKYIAVFIPGGHGAVADRGIHHSEEVKQVLKWTMASDKYFITLCHGPSSMLSAALGESKDGYIYKGYKVCVFPDALDRKNPDIGYMPGQMPWLVAEELRKLGVEVVNSDITGQLHQDRKLISGDSPLASNNIGKAAAQALLKEVEHVKKAAHAS